MEEIKTMDNDHASMRLQLMLEDQPDKTKDEKLNRDALSYAIDQLNLMSKYFKEKLGELDKKWKK